MNIIIKEVTSITELKRVWKLTQEVFASKFYMDYSPTPYSHYPHIDLSEDDLDLYLPTTVYTIYSQSKLLGSISCTLDDECGLSPDITFADITRQLRRNNVKLGASWRAVISSDCVNNRTILALLLDKVYHWIQINKIDYLIAEIHPRHVKFYQKIVGFTQLSKPRENIFVKNNPSILMMLDIKNNLCVWEKYREKLLQAKYRKNALRS